MAACEHVPAREWMAALQRVSLKRMDAFEPVDMLVLLLRAFAKLRWVPAAGWLTETLIACLVVAQACKAPGLRVLLDTCTSCK